MSRNEETMSTPEQAPWYVGQLQALGDSLQQQAVEQFGCRVLKFGVEDNGRTVLKATPGIPVELILDNGGSLVLLE